MPPRRRGRDYPHPGSVDVGDKGLRAERRFFSTLDGASLDAARLRWGKNTRPRDDVVTYP